MTPEITTIIPTHDRSSLLRVTLASVLWQREVDLEVLVIDDGSSDDTEEVVHGFHDRRVSVFRNDSPQGVSASRNLGIEHARGGWLAFVDDDDVWAPNKLCMQMAAASAAGTCWAYSGTVNIDLGLKVIGGRPPPSPDEVVSNIGRFNVVPGGGSNVMASTEAIRDVGGFDKRLYNTEDWEMWIRLAGLAPPAVVAAPLVGYRLHLMNASLDVDAILEGIALIEARHHTMADMGVIHRWLAESCLRRGMRGQALWHMATAFVRGQHANVTRDVLSILQRRFGSQRAPDSPDHVHKYSDYRRQAHPWLEDLGRVELAARSV